MHYYGTNESVRNKRCTKKNFHCMKLMIISCWGH